MEPPRGSGHHVKRRRVLLVGDHPVLRDDLKAVLARAGFEIVGEAPAGQAAVRMARERHPDIAVLNVVPPLAEGLDTARVIIEEQSCEHVVMLAGAAAVPSAGGPSVGAESYALRARAAGQLAEALSALAVGPRSPRTKLTALAADLPDVDPLTPREREVLGLIALGKSTREIAGHLNVTFKTAETHRGNIMAKLNLHRTADLVRYAIRRGLIEP